ncbi:MAG: YjjG family noncanonical pyrimidine nucleotidase [Cyclobacteriaceae bacterium]
MKYKHILFDLDHTLWDYDTNARETLSDLYDHYELGRHELFEKEDFIVTFFDINESLWSAYNKDQIAKGYIRENRFRQIFDHLRLPLKYYPQGIDDNYLHACPQKTNKIAHADEVLTYLKPHFQLHILTNGFNDVQSVKLEKSGLSQYFDKIVTSESAKAKKPNAAFFDHAISEINTHPEETLMIGDNLNTDIKGARDYGIDQVYYNPEKNTDYQSTYAIGCLRELKHILKK